MSHRAATLLGIVAGCRNIGVDPLGYLAWAFTRLGTHRDIYKLSAAQLTPAVYARAVPAQIRPTRAKRPVPYPRSPGLR